MSDCTGPIRTIGTLSGGAGSWGACRRWIDQHGPDGMVLLFTDVGGEDWANPNVGEDEDTMRFLREARDDLGVPLAYIRNQRTIWDVFLEKRWLGNSSLAHCSWELKTGPARDWIGRNAPEAQRVLVGIDVTEIHRLADIESNWKPYEAVAPLTDKPRLWKPQLLRMLAGRGIAPPRMYELGFAHANCFQPDERFITSEGVKTFRECLGKQVRVLGRGGGWRDAEVRSFGEQELWEIHLRRYSAEKTILTTAGHLWPVRKEGPNRTDYTFRQTSDLVPGRRIASMYGQLVHNVHPSPIGIAAGFTFGDGDAAVYSSGQNPPGRAFLCGDKDQALRPFFATCRATEEPGKVTIHDLPRSWKQRPDLSESQSYLYGWLAGYFAADGDVNGRSPYISSARKENLEFVRDLCTRLGIGTNPIQEKMRLGYGSTPTPLYTIGLIPSTLRPDFFVIPAHRERFESAPARTPRPSDWQIVSVRPTGTREEVMCAVVEDGHVFTLEGNVLTHNCPGCVKGGHSHWARLWRMWPERYLYAERKEQEIRERLGADVSILKDRSDHKVRSLTLERFRVEKLEKSDLLLGLFGERDLFDGLDEGGCACFTDASQEQAAPDGSETRYDWHWSFPGDPLRTPPPVVPVLDARRAA